MSDIHTSEGRFIAQREPTLLFPGSYKQPFITMKKSFTILLFIGFFQPVFSQSLDTMISVNHLALFDTSKWFTKEILPVDIDLERERTLSWQRFRTVVEIDSQLRIFAYERNELIGATNPDSQKELRQFMGKKGRLSWNRTFLVINNQWDDGDATAFLILKKEEKGYTVVKKIENQRMTDPGVFFSRDGNSAVIFNPFGRNFFTYNNLTGDSQVFNDYVELGIPGKGPHSGMKISSTGRYVSIFTSNTSLFDLKEKKIVRSWVINKNIAPGATFSADDKYVWLACPNSYIQIKGTSNIKRSIEFVIADIQTGEILEVYDSDSLNRDLNFLHFDRVLGHTIFTKIFTPAPVYYKFTFR